MDLNFLKLFNGKQEAKQQIMQPNILPTRDIIGRMNGIFNQIYAFFTDSGEGFDVVKTLTQARNYAISDAIIASFLRCSKNNVVGHTGFQLQNKFNALDAEKNALKNTLIENEWYKFGKAENFDISGRFNIVDFLQLALQQYLVDGEIVIRIFKIGKYGIKLQLLSFDSIDYTYNKGNVINGVEINQETTPVAYWIKDYNRKAFRVPAEEIIHVVNYVNSSGYRGISHLAPVIPLLKDVNTYIKADITAAINEATSVMTYESDKDYGRAYEGASSVADLANFKPGQATSSTSTGENILKAYENSSIRVGGMAIEALPPGVRLNHIASNHPSSSTPEFLKSFYKRLAAGLGVSYVTLMLDLDASTYSGGRQTASLERPTFKRFRTIIIEHILERIYKIWLTNYIKSNGSMFPKVNNSYDAYFEHEFMALGFDSINKKDDVESDILALQNGLASYTGILAERGIDLEDHCKTLKSDQEKIAKYGITLGQVISKQAENNSETAPQNTKNGLQNTEKQDKTAADSEDKTISDDDEITIINGD